MKFALITSPNGFGLVTDLRLSYHLALAQYAHYNQYADFYRQAQRIGDFIMVDNGAAELGSHISFEKILDFGNDIRADEIIMPDVLDDCKGTLQAMADTYHWVDVKYRAVVPQGRDWKEWLLCLEGLLLYGCQTICIAKRYERLPGGRARALELLRHRGLLASYNIHLLGFDKDPLHEVKAAKDVYLGIRGVDSAAPFAYAQNNMPIHAEHFSYEWEKDYDYGLAEGNARMIMQVCNAR